MPRIPTLSALTLVLGITSLPALSQGIKVIEPEKDVPQADVAALDTEHFEFGAYVGTLAVEDFNTNLSYGLALRYYLDARIFFEGSYGSSETQRGNNEGTRDFLSDRNFDYISVSAGYRVLKGRSFLGKKRKYNAGLYVLGGVSSVDFANQSQTGMLIGVSYKTVITDLITINLDFRDHIVKRDFLDDDKLTQNTEFSLGMNFIF